MTTTDPRPAISTSAPKERTPAGPDPLGSQISLGTQAVDATKGQISPQATEMSAPRVLTPAGTTTAPPASRSTAPKTGSLEGRKTSRSHTTAGTHRHCAAADDIPGRHISGGTQATAAAGEQAPAPANWPSAPRKATPVRDQDPPAQSNQNSAPRGGAPGLADPILALAADVLDDLERVRIGNENRLRQLTRDQADTDGIERGFGLDATHPDVARLAALVQLLADAEHQATLNLQRIMRKHPLGAWVRNTKGIGEKQGARLIAAIGDPYWNTLHGRPRTVSELWAYCGYHVIKAPVSGHMGSGAQRTLAADGPRIPASHDVIDTHPRIAGGEQNGSGSDPGHVACDAHSYSAGVAPKRQRGQRANWSATAKMRAYLAAESCMKQRESPYRAVYDATRVKYADATHATECARCGPKNNPAKPGSALSDGHKHARALRAVAKEILRDLWREARDNHHPLTIDDGTSDGAFALGAPRYGVPLQPETSRDAR